MWQLLFFVIFIFLIQGLSKVLEKETKKRRPQEKPASEEIEEYFESIGFPTIRMPVPKKERPAEKKKIEVEVPAIKEKPVLKPEIPKIKEEILSLFSLKPQIPKIKEEILPLFSLEKIEEGIILSEILGLPKSLRKPRW